jgi:hypothetical protein
VWRCLNDVLRYAGVQHPIVLPCPTDRAAIASTPAGMLPHGLPV